MCVCVCVSVCVCGVCVCVCAWVCACVCVWVVCVCVCIFRPRIREIPNNGDKPPNEAMLLTVLLDLLHFSPRLTKQHIVFRIGAGAM